MPSPKKEENLNSGGWSECPPLRPGAGMDAFSAARQREIYPLPPFGFQGKATEVLQDGAPRAWRSAAGFKELTSEGLSWLSDGVGALNCLAGRGYACSGAPHLAQRRAMAHVVDCFRQVPARPEGLTGGSAFRDLTSGCRLYCTDRSDVQPYAKLRISWPDVGAQPIAVSDFARPEDRERLIGWRQHLLRSAGDAERARQESGVVRPYMDLVLRRSKRHYGEFVKELSRRGLVRFRRCTSTSSTVGVLFHQDEIRTGVARLRDARRCLQWATTGNLYGFGLRPERFCTVSVGPLLGELGPWHCETA